MFSAGPAGDPQRLGVTMFALVVGVLLLNIDIPPARGSRSALPC